MFCYIACTTDYIFKEGFFRMEKGKFGIRLAFYGVAAFALAIFGNYTALLLLAAATIFVEKDEWASRQVIQALCLYTLPYLVNAAFDVLGFFNWFGWSSNGIIYGIYRGFSRVESIVSFIVNIAVILFAFMGIMKNAKGQEAGIPGAEKFAQWVYGKVAPKPVYVQQPMQPVQQPMQQAAPVQQPMQQAAPVQQPVQQAAPQAAGVCSNCGAPLNGAAFCTKCGTPANK